MMILLLTMTQQFCSCNGNNKSLDNNNSSLVDESKTHTLSFDTDGGNEIDPIVQETGTSIKMPYDPVKEGYTFIGWDKKVPDTMPNSDMTFKAQWIKGTMIFAIERNGTAAITSYKGETKELVLPDVVYNEYKLVEIRNFAFTGCTALASITIPSSVTTIKNGAFQNCTSLTNITISNSVKTIMGFSVFSGCSLLTIYCEATSQPSGWDSDWNSGRPVYYGITKENKIEKDGIIYVIQNNKAIVTRYVGNDTNVIIPKTIELNGKTYKVTTIGSHAYSNCTSLTSITIPSSVTTIGSYVFYNCNSSTSIIIPSSITAIGNYAFFNCKSLTSITIPSSVTTIGEDAFSDCTSLTSITIPKSVTTIGYGAFMGCSSLTIYCEATSQPSTFEYGWNGECPVYYGLTNSINISNISSVSSVPIGQSVTVTGVVVDARNNGKGFYIVDGTGAIYVYNYDGKAGVGTTIAWGTKVKLTAMRGENDGTYNKSSVQLVYNETAIITAMGKEAMPLTGAQDLTITQFKAWKTDGTEDYSGGFYKVRGYLAKYTPSGKDYSNYELSDDANYIPFFAVDSTVYATELADYFAEGKTTTSGDTTKTTAQFDVYLAVYDRSVYKNKWRVVPLAFVEVA